MAPQRPTTFFKAIVALSASTPHTCSATPGGGRVAQAFVGPDGALTQATVSVDAQGQSAPAGASALLAMGDGQLSQPYPAQSYHSPTPVAAAPYTSHVPVSSSSATYPSHAPAPYPSHMPVSSAPASVGPPCLVPMWSDEDYACKEYVEWETKGSWTDSLYRLRIEMPDGTKCTLKPPGKWGFWMAAETTEMNCKAGVWVDGKGKPILEIEMKTAQWFFIISAVAAAVAVYLLYKMFYDTESGWYTWRRDQAVKWGFAKAPPPPAQDAGGDAGASGPQPAININIANASGSQRAPEAQPR